VVRLCTAEDLIIHKALAGRPQDVLYIEGVVARHGVSPRRDMRRWLGSSRLVEDAEVIARFERVSGRHGGGTRSPGDRFAPSTTRASSTISERMPGDRSCHGRPPTTASVAFMRGAPFRRRRP
jgi:hypothetical protein